MSSTNRGGARADADFYPTPAHPVDRFLDRWSESTSGGSWVEFGAGDGAIIRATNAWCARFDHVPPPRWTAIELRAECRADLVATGAEVEIASVQEWARTRLPWTGLFESTFDHAPRQPLFDVAMFNPPFSQALVFVKIALLLARYVVCLERSPWIGDAAERYAFFHDLMPDEYRVGRIDFDGRGGDSIPYSWFVWGDGDRRRRRGALELLDPTPAAERVRGQLPTPRQAQLFGGTTP